MGELRWNADCLQRTGMKTVNVRATPALERPGRLGKVWLPEGPGGVTRGRRSPSHSPELKWSLDSHTQRQKERACQSMHTHPGRGRPRRQDPACARESGGPRPTEGTHGHGGRGRGGRRLRPPAPVRPQCSPRAAPPPAPRPQGAPHRTRAARACTRLLRRGRLEGALGRLLLLRLLSVLRLLPLAAFFES